MSAAAASMIFGKTPAGQAELSSRRHNLSLMGRRLLILVNGSRTREMLSQLVAANTNLDGELSSLYSHGLIEAVSGVAGTAPASVATTTEVAAPEKKGFLGRLFGLGGSTVRLEPEQHERMREACFLLQDMLGPEAEDFLMRLESSRNVDELQSMLTTASRLVAQVRGNAEAEMFRTAMGIA